MTVAARLAGGRLPTGAAVAAVLATVTLSAVLPLAPAARAAEAVEEVYPVPASREFAVDGRGYGHGRGLSQWGAQGAALQVEDTPERQRSRAEEILSFYYPGTASQRLADAPIRIVLTREGAEGRRPTGSNDRRYECDSDPSLSTHCLLEVLPATGLQATDDSRPTSTTTLPPADAWRVLNTASGLQLQAYTSGAWRTQALAGSTAMAGPVRFSGPETIRMRFRDGSLRAYRGDLQAVRTSATTAARVNVVLMEQYLRGVVPREAPTSWRAAALQAQSVAARSYSAEKRLGRGPSAVWHLCDSTFCQVYGGVGAEASSTDAALVATRETVRAYDGRPIVAEFSSSNGGWTAPGNVPYLQARQDPWDGSVSHSGHRWTGTLPASALEKAFPAVGRLTSVAVLSRNGYGEWGGRVGTVELRGTAPNGSPTAVRTTGEGVRFAWSWSRSARPKGLRSAWWQLGGPAPADVSFGAFSGSSGEVDLASRSADGAAVLRRWTASGGLSGATGLGGRILGAPAVVSRPTGGLEVFVRGVDNRLWWRSRTPAGAWSGWQDLGGALSGRPAAARFSGDAVHVVVVGTNGRVYQRRSVSRGAAWTGWEDLGGALRPGTGPAAVSTTGGRFDVVVQGTDRAVWRKSYASGWSGWSSLGGTVSGDPAVASSSGELTVVVRGSDGAGWARTVTAAGVSGWTALGGGLGSFPAAAAAPGSDRLDVFVTGTNGLVYRDTRTSAGWSGWQRVS